VDREREKDEELEKKNIDVIYLTKYSDIYKKPANGAMAFAD
jgi:hypothetical protein